MQPGQLCARSIRLYGFRAATRDTVQIKDLCYLSCLEDVDDAMEQWGSVTCWCVSLYGKGLGVVCTRCLVIYARYLVAL